jgi:hypothetical protein
MYSRVRIFQDEKIKIIPNEQGNKSITHFPILKFLISIRASSEMLNTLRDEKLSKKFKKFCGSEWSVENYLAYYDVIKSSRRKKIQHRGIDDCLF